MERQKLKLNSALRGYPAGAVIDIEMNSDGAPADGYWRRRLIDALSDHCVELVYEKKPDSPSKGRQDKKAPAFDDVKPKKIETKEE